LRTSALNRVGMFRSPTEQVDGPANFSGLGERKTAAEGTNVKAEAPVRASPPQGREGRLREGRTSRLRLLMTCGLLAVPDACALKALHVEQAREKALVPGGARSGPWRLAWHQFASILYSFSGSGRVAGVPSLDAPAPTRLLRCRGGRRVNWW